MTTSVQRQRPASQSGIAPTTKRRAAARERSAARRRRDADRALVRDMIRDTIEKQARADPAAFLALVDHFLLT